MPDVDGQDLAGRFVAANDEAVAYLLGPARERWHSTTDSEQWPVGVVARHIALGHELMLGWVRSLKDQAPITGPSDIDAINATEAARGVVASPEEVAQLLRDNGGAVTEVLRSLTGEDLQREVDFAGRKLAAAMLADAPARHVTGHLASIRAVVEG